MSQPSNVLRLYVEVRSSSDPSGGGETFGRRERSPPLTRSGLKDNAQDLLSRLSSQTPTRCRTRGPNLLHQSPSDSGRSQLHQPISAPWASERWSLPCDMKTSSKACSNRKEVIDGKRSVVSFSYVQKSNVKTLSSPGSNQERSHQVHKRISDPLWFGNPSSSCSSSPKVTFRPSGSLDPISRAATRRALEDFGSPLLRLKVAHALARSAWSQTHRPARCQSWSGSPVLHHNMNLKDRGMWGWPQTPVSDRQASQSPSPLFRGQRPADFGDDIVEGLNQLSGVSKRSPRRWAHPEESGPTTPQRSLKMNIPVHAAAADRAPPIGGPLHQSGQLLSSAPPSRSPSHPTRVHLPSRPPTELSSPIRDPGLSLGNRRPPDSPTLHRYQAPQYTGGNWRGSRCRERGEHSEMTGKVFIAQSFEGAPDKGRSSSQFPVPVCGTWHGVGLFPVPDSDQTCGEPGRLGSLNPTMQQKRAEQRRREHLLLGPVVPDSPDDDRDHPLEAMGGSSRSSSGVTGSLGDGECVSPESLQSGHQGNETGASTGRIQTDSAAPVLSLHCQKIARAKWEFLFGPEEGAGSGPANFAEASTAPPSGNSSESPTPTPPSSLPALSASQHVRHVEVELVTPPPPVERSLETGVIRRTLKYSETDLDAVPLRCYRETDIDELLMDGRDDEDSAFASNRSARGGSPQGSGLGPYGFGLGADSGTGEEEGSRERDQEEKEEEVVSWASVRMQGDNRKQQDTAQEQERHCPRMKRASECFFDTRHPALKSPIRVSGPRGAAEDTFSRHFESIMESACAKGTSYDRLYGRATAGRPALAPLARQERPTLSDSDATRAPSSERLSSGSEDTPPGRRGYSQLGNSWGSQAPSVLRETAVQRGVSDREGDASDDATRRLRRLDDSRQADAARRLSGNNDFSRPVADEYLTLFDFSHLRLDRALRVFLKQVAVLGESHNRERLLAHFSRRYWLCNPRLFPSSDAVHTLTCALVLLNADLHGPNIGAKMSRPQFVDNLEGLDDGRHFRKHLLKALYNSIKTQKLQWTLDEEELRKSFSELGDSLCDSSSSAKGAGGGAGGGAGDDGDDGTLVEDETAPCGMPLYKNGFLVRKVHADSDGKRTPRGKRGWKTFYAILKGLILYLQKGEYRADKPLTDEDLKNAVSIHHSLAMKAFDYSKRANVFYLRTADWRLFLFQAPNADQMHSWITRINTLAATYSAPPFPPAIGSQKKFSRPLLPGNVSKLSEEEQVRSHEARLRAVSSELAELRSSPPERKLKAGQLDQYQRREQHLRFEKTRYETYVALLRAKTEAGGGGEDRPRAPEDDEGDPRGARSDPATQDAGRAGVRRAGGEPRQDVQRHSYRQAVKK
ncbi:PH and SEC7 domain-containing protein 1-like [Phycodurus eques]|uniref:PH and SEC7 domain-containing protein 1-like n=1 Tax=Phycodurus eques TaxID=693459 RepID=UPI002ACE1686|nr:PH and SEC7 domain-containing protein 1-like [Phycodurus eques]XP_061561797.1 PH and SEC7 domain-containing protein 1-like [Phycodurus eques]